MVHLSHKCKDVGVKLAAESLTREALIEILADSAETYTPDSGDYTQLVIHSSITIFSPELAVFLGYNQPTLISALTDWWDCRDPWSYHTKGGGGITCKCSCTKPEPKEAKK